MEKTKEEQIKIIYDYMGWCVVDRRHKYPCNHCDQSSAPCKPLDGNDILALKDKMVEKGDWHYRDWHKFHAYAFSVSQYVQQSSGFTNWLFSLDLDGGEIPRFFRLFIESGVWKK